MDVRPAAAFGAGHPAGAVNVGLGGQFAAWSGALLPPEKSLVLVTEDESGAAEAVTRLARVGLENVAGYLDGGVAAWDAAGRPLGTDGADRRRRAEGAPRRRPGPSRLRRAPAARVRGGARAGRGVRSARPARPGAGRADAQGPVAIICASGYRSSIAGSLLLGRKGVEPINVVGGTSAWIAAGYSAE